MDSADGLLAEVEARLAAEGHPALRVVETRSSNQSDLKFLEATAGDTAERFVLKIFSERCEWNSAEAVRIEFRALERFFERLRRSPGLTCPRPIAVFDRHLAYLMTHVPGRGLSTLLDSGTTVDDGVLSNIVRGLEAFHEEPGGIYGDFHSGNIIVGPDGGVGFVDPTIADPTYYLFPGRDRDPLGTDLGYWLHTVSSRTPKMLARAPGRARRRIDFAVRLFARAVRPLPSTGRDAVTEDILRVARGHLAQMRHRQLRGWALEPLALLVAHRIIRRVRDL